MQEITNKVPSAGVASTPELAVKITLQYVAYLENKCEAAGIEYSSWDILEEQKMKTVLTQQFNIADIQNLSTTLNAPVLNKGEITAGWYAIRLLDFKIVSERLKSIEVVAFYECKNES